MPTSKTFHVIVAALCLVAAAASLAPGAPAAARKQEAELIAVLKSDAPQKEKADACRELGHVGTKKAVAPLAALLADEKLSHMARYGLEPIPDPAVDVALRDALGKLKGRLLVGVIGSLGVRHDTQAVGPLTKLLQDPDDDVAQAAARALGKIGGAPAVKALLDALANVSDANQVALCEGLFRSAEALAADGKRDDALAIYDRLRGLKKPHQVRAGGLRGAILARGQDGLPLLLEALRGDDFVLVAAAARMAMEMGGADVAKALAGELAKLPADKKVLVIQTLGRLGDKAALPALLAAAKSGEKPVRLAAIRAMPMIGDAAAASALVQLMEDAEADVAKAAQECLAALSGPDVDAAIAAMVKDKDPLVRRTGVELLGRRRIQSAIPTILKAAEDPEESVRIAGLKTLGALGGEAELQPMLALLVKAKTPAETQAAEGALSAICGRQTKPVAGNVVIRKAVYGALPDGPSVDVTKKVAEMVKAGTLAIEASNSNFGDPANGTTKKLLVEYTVDGRPGTGTVAENDALTITASVASPACVNALCAAMAKAEGPAKLALMRVLVSVGGAKALDVVRDATKDTSAEVKDAALRLLCEWPTAEALPDLERLARTSADAKVKILALRGTIRLIPQQNVLAEKKLASLKEAMALAERPEEKKLVLGALGGIHTAGALALVAPHLTAPDLKEEAAMAAVGIAEKIVQSHPAPVADAMQKVVESTTNKQVGQRAQKLLDQAKKAAPRR